MSGGLQDKIVLVAGAGDGVGRASALLAATAGAQAAVNDLGLDNAGEDDAGSACAEQATEEIRRAGGQAVANGGDAARSPAARRGLCPLHLRLEPDAQFGPGQLRHHFVELEPAHAVITRDPP